MTYQSMVPKVTFVRLEVTDSGLLSLPPSILPTTLALSVSRQMLNPTATSARMQSKPAIEVLEQPSTETIC